MTNLWDVWRRQDAGTRRIAWVGAAVFLLDQATKFAVERTIPYGFDRVVIDGFFNLVHWGNTGSAWSMFRNNNYPLAAVSGTAMVMLWVFRSKFEAERRGGQFALGFLFGGIVGNLLDRLLPSRRHVVDFLYFHVYPRGGGELGFPAFNVADSAICAGVGLLLWLSWSPAPRSAGGGGAKASAT